MVPPVALSLSLLLVAWIHSLSSAPVRAGAFLFLELLLSAAFKCAHEDQLPSSRSCRMNTVCISSSVQSSQKKSSPSGTPAIGPHPTYGAPGAPHRPQGPVRGG